MQVDFTTLALGAVYRRLARLLAADLARWSPQSRLVVLTDRPDEFVDLANVDPVAHQQVSIFRPYHDKRCTFRERPAVDVQMYLDADSRIFAPPSIVTDGGDQPAAELRASGVWRLVDKYQAEARHEAGLRTPAGRVWSNTVRNRERLVRAAADAVHVDFEQVQFVYEYCFCVPGQGAALNTFLETWRVLANFLERRGLTWGEGEVIGIAAAAAGWNVRPLTSSRDWLFNDVIARNRLAEGQRLGDRETALLGEYDVVRSQVAPPSLLTRTWRRVKPLVKNPLLGPGVYLRRWSTLRGA